MTLTSPASGQTITSVSFPFTARSVDRTANRVHFLLDQQPGTDLVALAEAGQGRAYPIERDEFQLTIPNLTRGNHRIDVVAYEAGRSEPSVRTFAGIRVELSGFDGMGDMNNDGKVTNRDIFSFIQMAASASQFNPRADFNGDGLVTADDVPLFAQKLYGAGVPQSVVQAMTEQVKAAAAAASAAKEVARD